MFGKSVSFINVNIVYAFLFVWLIIIILTASTFNHINHKAKEILSHKSFYKFELMNIKYNIMHSKYYFLEYSNGNKNSADGIIGTFDEIYRSLNLLKDFEQGHEHAHSFESFDYEHKVEQIFKLKQKLNHFEDVTMMKIDNIKNNISSPEINYDAKCDELLAYIDSFLHNLILDFEEAEKNLDEEITNMLTLMAILIFFSVQIIVLIILYSINQRKKEEIKNKILESQSKFASMGEMIDAIAHQWKSPLSSIALYADYVDLKSESDSLEKKDVQENMSNIKNQVMHLNTTLDEFRGFFRPNTKVYNYEINELLETTLLLVKDELTNNRINTKINVDRKIYLTINKNDFKHIFLNFISNSKHAFIEKNIETRNISFTIEESKDFIIIEYLDNAKGIDEKVIDSIFEANVTTKSEENGTGIGLYLVKRIIEKYHGEIKVSNKHSGALFKVRFHKKYMEALK